MAASPVHDPSAGRLTVVACALLALAGLVLSVQLAVSMAPLRQADERAHAGYAIEVAYGHLPTIDTPIPQDPHAYPGLTQRMIGEDSAHRDIWTANHPPLFYVLAAPLVRLGDAIDHPGFALIGMRALNGIGLAAVVLLVGLIAREMVPRRRLVPVVASALALSCGAVPYLGGAIYNDGPASAAAFAALLLGLRMIRHGVTRTRFAAAVAFAVAAAAFRSSGMMAVVAVAVAVATAVLLREPTRRGLVRAGSLAAVAGAVPLATIGWFYLRNIGLYGDATASSALFTKFGRTPNGSTVQVLLDPHFYRHLLGSLWTDGDLPNRWGALGATLGVLSLAGLVVEALRGAPYAGRGRVQPERLEVHAVRALVAGYAVLMTVSVAGFIGGGGWVHARYAIPLLPALCPPAAVGLLAVGRVLLRWLGPAELTEDDRELRVTLPLVTLLVALAVVCHLDTELVVDRTIDSLTVGGVIVFGDLAAIGAVASVLGLLGRMLGPARAAAWRSTAQTPTTVLDPAAA